MFKPSLQTAQRAYPPGNLGTETYTAEVQKTPTETELLRESLAPPALVRPDVHSHYFPAVLQPVDYEQVREAMAEKIIRLLGTLCLRHAPDVGQATIPVLTADAHFSPEVAQDLQERLGLTNSSVLPELGQELASWVQHHPHEAAEQGLFQQVDQSIHLICPALQPAFDALL